MMTITRINESTKNDINKTYYKNWIINYTFNQNNIALEVIHIRTRGSVPYWRYKDELASIYQHIYRQEDNNG